MKTKLRATWRNTIKKHKTHPLKYMEPESLRDIKEAIREAEKLGFNVRAVGSGHSELAGLFYPELDKWLESFRFFNPEGTFSNDFSDRLTAVQKACTALRDQAGQAAEAEKKTPSALD